MVLSWFYWYYGLVLDQYILVINEVYIDQGAARETYISTPFILILSHTAMKSKM